VTKHEDYGKQFRIEDDIHDHLVMSGRVKTPIITIFHDIKKSGFKAEMLDRRF
jgi:hypothetical protein